MTTSRQPPAEEQPPQTPSGPPSPEPYAQQPSTPEPYAQQPYAQQPYASGPAPAADPGYPGPQAPAYPPAGYPVPQPAAGYGPPPGPLPPDNYLVWAILSTILCCLPLGIVSIVYAAQVNDKWARGDVAGATESAAKARQFAIWSAAAYLVVAVVVIILYVGFFAVLLGTGAATSP